MKFEDFYNRIKAVQVAMVSTGIALPDSFDEWCNYTDDVRDVLGRTIGVRCRPGGAWRTEKDLWVCPESDGHWTFKNFVELTDDDFELFCKQHEIYDLVPDFVVPNRVNPISIIQDEDEDFVV